jgi:hypothetical protein
MSLNHEERLTKIAEALFGISHELERLNAFLEERAVTVSIDPESKLDVDVNNTVFTSSAE